MSNSLNVLNRGKTPVWTVIILAWPTIIEQLLVSLTNYVDVAMVGALGAVATAAVGMCSSTTSLVIGILTAISVGLSVQVAQAIGADDIEGARTVVKQSFRVFCIMTPILIIAAIFLSWFIPYLMGAEADVGPLASSYLLIVGCGWPFKMIVLLYSAILRCVGQMRLPLVFNAMANLLNVVFNFLLIYPTREIRVFGYSFTMWGANLGVAGAALGTIISMAIGALCIFSMVMVKNNPLKVPFGCVKEKNAKVMKKMFQLGIPLAMERVIMSTGQIVMTKIVTGLGTIALAANHLATTAEGICYLPGLGFANSATTLIGQSVGAKQKDSAIRFGNITIVLAAIVSLSMSVLLFLFAPQILSLFTKDGQVIDLGKTVLRIIALSQGFLGVNAAVGGILRGAGDTKWQFYSNVIGIWGVRIILAVLLGRVCGFGLIGVWIASAIDLAVRLAIILYRYFGKKWTKIFDKKEVVE